MIHPSVDANLSRRDHLPDLRNPLEAFRIKTKRASLHPLEKAALWVISAHLMFLPWALGTMRLPAQWTSFALSIVSLAIALIPRNYSEEQTDGVPFRLVPWSKLLKFPIFWIGLALLALIIVQALNPAWRFVQDSRSWWMTATEHIEWLPRGVEGPFERGGPWRNLMIYAATWMTTCAVWIGFTRRRTLQIFLTVIVVNGLLVALLGIAQRLVPTDKIFWLIPSPNAGFFASFIYRNHAAGFLHLVLVATLALAVWYYQRGVRRLEKSTPAGLFGFFGACLAVGLVLSYSRGTTLVMLAFFSICVIGFLVRRFNGARESRQSLVFISLVLVLGAFLAAGLLAFQSQLHAAWERMERLAFGEDDTVKFRQQANQATSDMVKAQMPLGAGSGSFRFLFPMYQQRYPDIFIKQTGLLRGRRYVWDHAHNDFLEFTAELGVPGLLIIAGGFLYWGVQLIGNGFWRHSPSLMLVLGALLTVAHSWVDFLFRCPAILTLWCVLWAVAGLWSQFEERPAEITR
jgi:O-antigen ligase